jgi:hypothetical protein
MLGGATILGPYGIGVVPRHLHGGPTQPGLLLALGNHRV